MKKRILIINHSLQQGGIVRSLIAAFHVIDPHKYDITLYVHRDQPELASLVPQNVRVVVNHDTHHYYRRPKAVFLQILQKLLMLLRAKDLTKKITDKLNRLIHNYKIKHPQKDCFKKEHFDIVIAYSVDICTEIALNIPADRQYAFFHSSKIEFHRDMTERCFPQFDRIVAVSSGVEAVLNEGFPSLRDRTVCLSNFVDGETLRALSQETNVYKDYTTGFRICSCGRLSHEKGYDLAVEAAQILKNRNFDFVWYFVGDGSERGNIENRILELSLQDHIRITGYLLNPYPYVGGCDLYVQPSYEEAQPLSVLEARVLGKAIVSTDTVGGRTILENGKKGILTPISAKGLADGIETLLTDPERRRSFENLYTQEDNLREKQTYEAAWNRLLSE